MKQRLSEQECLDVRRIMMLTAEKEDTPDECSAIMKRGALLLRQATCFCTLFCRSYSHLKEKYAEDAEFTIGSERLLRAIFEGKEDDDDDIDDETD